MTTGQRIAVGCNDSDLPLHRQERLRGLVRAREAEEQLATARLLERRAETATNAALATLLRERAGVRRRRAQRLLAGQPPGVPSWRPRG